MVTNVVQKIGKRLSGAIWGLVARNKFVYDACLVHGVALPDIPVVPVEFYGQCGEDLIVLALLEARAVRLGLNPRIETYLEIGGNHPFAASATFLLHERLGMRGAIVEANKALLDRLRKGRPDDTIVYGAVQDRDVGTVMLSISKKSELSSLDRNFVKTWDKGRVGEAALVEVPALRINRVIETHLGGRSLSFLSIDVEGLDFAILRDLDLERFRPYVIQLEPSDDYIPGNTDNVIEYLKSFDYGLVAKTPVNLIFEDRR
jgi:FkbM family methyltransferase